MVEAAETAASFSMFFYRFNPASTHLHKYESEMHLRYLQGRCEQVQCEHPILEAYKFHQKADGELVYFLVNPKVAKKTPIKESKEPHPAIPGFVALSKMPRWTAREVTMVYVNPEIRARGLGQLIYDTVLRDNILLMSGVSHCIKSKRLWMSLIQNPNYQVWAHDIMNLNRCSQVWIEDDDIKCDFQLYRDIKTKRRVQREDIRLLAIYKAKS